MRITKRQLKRIIREEVAYAKQRRLIETAISKSELKKILQRYEEYLGTRREYLDAWRSKPGSDPPEPPREPTDFEDKNLQGIDLRGVNLPHASFRKSNLQKADFRGANLNRVNFYLANLQGANFQGANLQAANFRKANLQGANLLNTNLKYCNFKNADLRGAKLDSSIEICWEFDGAKFTPDALPILTQHPTWSHSRLGPQMKDMVQIEGMSPEEVANYGNNRELAISEARIRYAVMKSLKR